MFKGRRAGRRRGGPRPASRRLLILGELRLDRKLGWIIAVFLILIGTIVGYNARATARGRDAALLVNIAARQRALAERYIKDVILKVDGHPADPHQDAVSLEQTAEALLYGGQVTPVQGADDLITISPYEGDWKVVAKLDQERKLLFKLVGTGDQLLQTSRTS